MKTNTKLALSFSLIALIHSLSALAEPVKLNMNSGDAGGDRIFEFGAGYEATQKTKVRFLVSFGEQIDLSDSGLPNVIDKILPIEVTLGIDTNSDTKISRASISGAAMVFDGTQIATWLNTASLVALPFNYDRDLDRKLAHSFHIYLAGIEYDNSDYFCPAGAECQFNETGKFLEPIIRIAANAVGFQFSKILEGQSDTQMGIAVARAELAAGLWAQFECGSDSACSNIKWWIGGISTDVGVSTHDGSPSVNVNAYSRIEYEIGSQFNLYLEGGYRLNNEKIADDQGQTSFGSPYFQAGIGFNFF